MTVRPIAGLAAALAIVTSLSSPTAASALEPPPTPGTTGIPRGWPRPPEVTADAYLLVDADTGQTLAALRPDEDRAVASTVKVLTAISVLERTTAATRVTVGREVTGFAADAAGVGLDPGETWTVEDLLEGLIARSGNDAANALAVAVGGSVGGFVDLMREDAAEIGVSVRLTSPTGLDDENRLSARDLVALSRVALDHREFAAIAARPRVELPDLGAIPSRNALLGEYPGAYGVKTGFTDASGRCIVAAVTRGELRLIAVVLGSDGPTDHFADATALLDFGFNRFRGVAVADDGPELQLRTAGRWIDVGSADVHAVTPRDDPPVELDVDLPVEVDDDPGELIASWRGSVLVETDLAPAETPEAPSTPGGWLADRAYAAMRAATAADAWEAR